jgi:hypothetical protein
MGWFVVRISAALFLLAIALPDAAQAETPPHLVLARPQATSIRSPYSPAVKVLAQPYPYGYFGACGTTHWQRQFGIYRTYTQWSQK